MVIIDNVSGQYGVSLACVPGAAMCLPGDGAPAPPPPAVLAELAGAPELHLDVLAVPADLLPLRVGHHLRYHQLSPGIWSGDGCQR